VNAVSIPPQERLVTLPDSIPEYTLGWEAIRWATAYLRQPDGPRAGERWEFVESQIRFLLHWYALTGEGEWVYGWGARRWAKGAGKSPSAAVLALIEFLAPVRLDHFDPSAPGGVVGKPVSMPLVQIAGIAESSAMINTMRVISALTPKRSRLVQEYSLDTGKTVMYAPQTAGQLHIITNSASAAEGALVTFGVLDESEHWVPANGGTALAQVMRRNLRKSKSRGIETSNAWQPGAESVAEKTFETWCAEEEGRRKGTGRTLMDVRMAPPDIDWDDPTSIHRAVKFAYGDCYWVDPKDIVNNGVLDPNTPLETSKRFYLNWPTVPEDAWTEPQLWARMANRDYMLRDGAEITLGFDGSRSQDATALVGCELETGYTFLIGVWEPNREEPGYRVPVDEVDEAVAMAFSKWSPVAFFADTKEWENSVTIAWPKLYKEQLAVWAVHSGRDPQPISWDMRTKVAEFTKACEAVEAEINDGLFEHDGDSRLARHVANARRYPNRHGISIHKETPDSPKKIDAIVAAIIARHARRLALASPELEKRRNAAKKGGAVYSFS
jgi:hypothetical protein